MNDNIIQYVIDACNGDTDAIAKLYSRTLKGSYFLASKLCDSEEEAADITRKAYAKAFCAIDKLKKPEAFEIWMKQMIASLYKESRKFVFADADGGAHEPDSDFLPEAILSNEADAQKVVAAIASLTPERRTAIILHYYNGMPVSVLAKFYGVSESTANAILSKARSEIVEKSGVKAPDYPELSTLPVLTRLFNKLAAEVKIDNSVVRDMFIFILEVFEEAKPAQAVEETAEEVPVAEEVTEEAVEIEETAEEPETETEEETEAEETVEETAEEPETEEAEEVEEVAETEEIPEEKEETAEETVDRIEEEIVSFKDRISSIIGTDADETEEEPAEEETEAVAEETEDTQAEEVAETEEIAEEPETEAQGDELLEAIKRSMDELNDFAESDEVVDLDEDTGAISFSSYKKEEESAPAEPVVLPAETVNNEAVKSGSDKKSKLDKKVIIIAAAIAALIIAVIAIVIGVSSSKKDDGETTNPTSAYSSDIATKWKEIDALNTYDSITYLNEEYAMFKKGGKFGLLDNAGNVVLNAEYESFKMCSDGKDYKDEKDYHLLAINGGKAYEVKYENGIPVVTSTVHTNHATNTTATPGSDKYVERDRYYEGYAAVQNADGKWGYVAKDSDKLVVDYLYDAPNAHSYAADSCRGFDKGVVAVKKDGKMGIINMDGTVVPFEYEEILQGEDGVYLAKKDGKWGHLLVGDEAIAFYADYKVVTEAPASSVPDAPAGEVIGKYTARDDINVRSKPRSDSDKLGTIDAGATVEVYEIRDSENKKDSNKFAKVEFDGQIGWVSMGLLEEE